MQPADSNTASGSLQQNIQFIFSEYDNQLRREKTITGMRNKFLKGEWCMKPPMGYDIITINGKRSIVINKDGELIRKAFLWKYYENLSQMEICNRLALMGLKMIKQKVSKMLKNPFYCGIISVKTLQGKVVNGTHEKLVSQDIFLAVNELFLKSDHCQNTVCLDNPELPLRRFLKCNVCQVSYTGSCVTKKPWLFYYKCRTVGCIGNRRTDAIHLQFIEILSKVKIDEKNYPNLKKDFADSFIRIEKLSRENDSQYRRNLTNIKKKIEELEERFVFGDLSENLHKKYLEKLIVEQMQVEAQINKLNMGLVSNGKMIDISKNIMKNLSNLWLKSTLETKRIIQSTIFPEGIYYDRQKDKLFIRKLALGFVFIE
jgi:site-specific DNA recombinase